MIYISGYIPQTEKHFNYIGDIIVILCDEIM